MAAHHSDLFGNRVQKNQRLDLRLRWTSDIVLVVKDLDGTPPRVVRARIGLRVASVGQSGQDLRLIVDHPRPTMLPMVKARLADRSNLRADASSLPDVVVFPGTEKSP